MSIRRRRDGFDWEAVEVLAYKEEGAAPFKAITRRTLFDRPDMAGELRYFEIAAGGHSTLERHQHAHAVMILTGRGRCLIGGDVHLLGPMDLVDIAPGVWHQFRAAAGETLGFLCLVDRDRDRPSLPTPDERAELCADAVVAAFLGED